MINPLHYTSNLKDLQEEMLEWQKHNFPNSAPYIPLLGALEELGELAHAHIKSEQGIRGTKEEHHAAKVDAIGDVIIYLVDYCNRFEINLSSALYDTWHKVKQRDWQKDKVSGGEKAIEFQSGDRQ